MEIDLSCLCVCILPNEADLLSEEAPKFPSKLISIRFTARDDKFDWVRLMNLGNEGELLVTVSEPARC